MRVTSQDVLVLVELIQRTLPRLDFNDPDQALAGDELLRLVNHVGALYEYGKEKGMIVKFSNGKEITIEDVVKDPKAEALEWLKQYKKESPGRPGLTPISLQEGSYDVRENCTTD